jgi:hypothetical protein
VPKYIMIYTLHYDYNANEWTTKPEIILFYHQTKGGVDVFNGMSGVCRTPPYHFCYIFPPHQRRVKTQRERERERSVLTLSSCLFLSEGIPQICSHHNLVTTGAQSCPSASSKNHLKTNGSELG